MINFRGLVLMMAGVLSVLTMNVLVPGCSTSEPEAKILNFESPPASSPESESLANAELLIEAEASPIVANETNLGLENQLAQASNNSISQLEGTTDSKKELDNKSSPENLVWENQFADPEVKNDLTEAPGVALVEIEVKVKKGDWLSKIARKYLGDANKWRQIHRDNPHIKNPNVIFPGQILVLQVPIDKLEPSKNFP